MNELSSYLRRTLCEAWRNGYGEEARRAAIVAPLLTLIGFAAAWFFPQLTDHVMGVLEQAIDSAGLSSVTETRDMAAAIFANNLTAAFSAILWGLVPFAYLAAFPLGFNFCPGTGRGRLRGIHSRSRRRSRLLPRRHSPPRHL